MARNELRPVIKLRSTAGTGFTYVTRKNRRNDPDRMTLRKFGLSRVRMREQAHAGFLPGVTKSSW